MHTQSTILIALAGVGYARFGQEGAVQNIIQALGNFGPQALPAPSLTRHPALFWPVPTPAQSLSLPTRLLPRLVTTWKSLLALPPSSLPRRTATLLPTSSRPSAAMQPSQLPPGLWGILPAVGPALVGADMQNANSAQSLVTPLADGGLNVADLSRAQGFSDFTDQA